MIMSHVVPTLTNMGVDVIDLGLATTPTIELAVINFGASGGIIITASHNPIEWNGLKFLNAQGEFITSEHGLRMMEYAESETLSAEPVKTVGTHGQADFLDEHIRAILALALVRRDLISAKGFTIAVDAVNSVGGTAIPALLKALGVQRVIEVNCEPTGMFAHNPEPLPEHLTDLSKTVIEHHADIGISVDPDVDRMALVCEDGSMFGEEYGLVAVSDYVLSHTLGNTVSNLSSTRALKLVTQERGGEYFPAAVGEVNVVKRMKEVDAVIGGEGNGGIIYPKLHYGRDALAGVALFLSALAESDLRTSELRKRYPFDVIAKKKVELNGEPGAALERVRRAFTDQPKDETDGIRLEFGKDWVHIRPSNTEPIMRIYAESGNAESAEQLAQRVMSVLR